MEPPQTIRSASRSSANSRTLRTTGPLSVCGLGLARRRPGSARRSPPPRARPARRPPTRGTVENASRSTPSALTTSTAAPVLPRELRRRVRQPRLLGPGLGRHHDPLHANTPARSLPLRRVLPIRGGHYRLWVHAAFQARRRLLTHRRPAEGDRRHRRGRRVRRARGDAAGRHRHRQDDDDGGDDRAAAAAGARARPQQDAGGPALQRVPDVLPVQRRRVLRLVLRLLPARGLRPEQGPLHREGLGDQPGDRPAAPRRHGGAVRAARRRDRGVACRPSSASARRRRTTTTARSCSRAATSTATSCCASSSTSSTTATTRRSGAARSACAGDTLEVFPAYAETAFRALLFGDEVERLQHFDPLTGELIVDDLEHVAIWPATHYNVKEGTMERAVEEIGRELNHRTAELEAEGKLLESHRLRQRTQYDMEMLREVGFCSGIENYSRILDGRPPGARPYCLIDYFPEDFVCFIDESHQTVPQLGAMYEGDRSRKTTLVDYGFRLPSALDNRPQTFDEFLSISPQLVFVSATPGPYEREHSATIVEQIVRPTGIVDPEVEVRETRNQIDDLMREIRARTERNERVLVTTLDEEDERGPDGLPARDGLQGPLPALGGRHAGADPDHPRAAARRVRRADRRQPPARGARPAGGLAGRDPRRRQGGLPARRDLADPDDRARGPQRRGQGPDVRRQADRGDAQGDRRDRPPARDPGRSTTSTTASRRRRSSRASPTSRSS